jgi:hypothetical protein
VDSRIGFTEIKNCRFLHPHCRLLYAGLVSSPAPLAPNVELIVEQGCEDLYCINCVPNHPLAATEENPIMYDKPSPPSFLCCVNPWPSGVAVSFVLMWAILTVQAYWVCEITQPGWKQVPESICVLPRAVPITQVISKFLPSLVLASVCLSAWFPATVISDSILVATPLMVRWISRCSDCLSSTNLDR